MEPLACHLYQVRGRIYRRNVPFEQIARGNPALNARVYEGAEEEEPLDCVVAPSGTQGL